MHGRNKRNTLTTDWNHVHRVLSCRTSSEPQITQYISSVKVIFTHCLNLIHKYMESLCWTIVIVSYKMFSCRLSIEGIILFWLRLEGYRFPCKLCQKTNNPPHSVYKLGMCFVCMQCWEDLINSQNTHKKWPPQGLTTCFLVWLMISHPA